MIGRELEITQTRSMCADGSGVEKQDVLRYRVVSVTRDQIQFLNFPPYLRKKPAGAEDPNTLPPPGR
jgi:hypothetical protein